MIKITETAKYFFEQNWNFGEYFQMLKTRFLHAHDMFAREFGSNGDWLFWGFLFFLVLIALIYIKSLKEMFGLGKNSAENDEAYEEDVDYDDYEYIVSEKSAMIASNDSAYSRQQKMERKFTKRRNNAKIRELAELEKDEELSQAIIANSAAETEKNETDTENYAVYDAVEDLKIPTKKYVLPDMVGLIICLLGRKVTDNKIAQTLYFLLQDANVRDEIFQMIRAIKDFIGYCNAGRFDSLKGRDTYPDSTVALYHWANGDSNDCLELLEAVLASQIAAAQSMAEISKNLTYALAADYACTLGTIGSYNNYELATNSFELATEMAPHSINALNLCANMYRKDGNHAKAKDMYLKVLEMADGITYPEQKANAGWWLAKYYKEQGNTNKSIELENEANSFYSKCGLNEELTPQEKEVLDIIESTKDTTLAKYIKQLLNITD